MATDSDLVAAFTLELQTRLDPTDDTIEQRIGAFVLACSDDSSAAVGHLDRLGWRRSTVAGAPWRWYRDLADTPRELAPALGCAYLAGLHDTPALWDSVLGFDSHGQRTLTAAGFNPDALPGGAWHRFHAYPRRYHDDADFARACGALFAAHGRMRPITPWGKVPTIRRSLESLARMHLPPLPPSQVVDSPIPADYLARYGTALE